jgi:hypothetical protein
LFSVIVLSKFFILISELSFPVKNEKTGLKNSLVKNASDILMSKTIKKANHEKMISQQKTYNGKWIVKDENEFSSFKSGVQMSANTVVLFQIPYKH